MPVTYATITGQAIANGGGPIKAKVYARPLTSFNLVKYQAEEGIVSVDRVEGSVYPDGTIYGSLEGATPTPGLKIPLNTDPADPWWDFYLEVPDGRGGLRSIPLGRAVITADADIDALLDIELTSISSSLVADVYAARDAADASATEAAGSSLAAAATAAAYEAAVLEAIGAASVGSVVDRVATATVAGGTTYTANLAVADVFVLTLTGNATLAVSGLSVGRSFLVQINQDATGGRTLTRPTAYGTVSLTTAASTFETLTYRSNDGVRLIVHQATGGGTAVPPPAPLDPGTLSPIAEYDAVTLADTHADAGVVTTWTDDSGNAHGATNATSTKRPLMRYSVASTGVKGVFFDGVDDVLKATPWTNSVLDGGLTDMGVFYMESKGGVKQVVASGSTGSGRVKQEFYKDVPGKFSAFASVTLSAPTAGTLGTWHRYLIEYRSGTTTRLWIDGVMVAEGSTGTAPTGSTRTLGNDQAETGAMQGAINYSVMLPRILTDNERTAVDLWLAARYGA